MIGHSEYAWVIDSSGHTRDILDTDPGPATSATKSSFAVMLADTIEDVAARNDEEQFLRLRFRARAAVLRPLPGWPGTRALVWHWARQAAPQRHPLSPRLWPRPSRPRTGHGPPYPWAAWTNRSTPSGSCSTVRTVLFLVQPSGSDGHRHQRGPGARLGRPVAAGGRAALGQPHLHAVDLHVKWGPFLVGRARGQGPGSAPQRPGHRRRASAGAGQHR